MWSVGEEWDRGSQQAERRRRDRVSLPCDSFFPPHTGILFIPLHGKNTGFLLEGGLLGHRASHAPGARSRSLWLVAQDACRAFTSHLFVYEHYFHSACAFLLSDLWAGSPLPCSGWGLAAEMPFLFSFLFSHALF